jgi:hypothetical protein
MNGAPPKMKDLANVSQYLPDNIDNWLHYFSF